jgi:hypothetical protein
MPARVSPKKQPTHTTDFIASDVDKVRFYDDPMTDNIVTAILALGAETWSNRRRTLILERLLQEKGVSQEMIEGYMPTEEDVAEWKTERDRLVEMVMGPLMREGHLPPSTKWQNDE